MLFLVFLLPFFLINSAEHDLYMRNTVSPNVMFMIDVSGSMALSVCDVGEHGACGASVYYGSTGASCTCTMGGITYTGTYKTRIDYMRNAMSVVFNSLIPYGIKANVGYFPAANAKGTGWFWAGKKWYGARFMSEDFIKLTNDSVYQFVGVNSSGGYLNSSDLDPHGTTPSGDALIKAYDYLYNNNDELLSCRQNILILITDGVPVEDNPSKYIWRFGSDSDHNMAPRTSGSGEVRDSNFFGLFGSTKICDSGCNATDPCLCPGYRNSLLSRSELKFDWDFHLIFPAIACLSWYYSPGCKNDPLSPCSGDSCNTNAAPSDNCDNAHLGWGCDSDPAETVSSCKYIAFDRLRYGYMDQWHYYGDGSDPGNPGASTGGWLGTIIKILGNLGQRLLELFGEGEYYHPNPLNQSPNNAAGIASFVYEGNPYFKDTNQTMVFDTDGTRSDGTIMQGCSKARLYHNLAGSGETESDCPAGNCPGNRIRIFPIFFQDYDANTSSSAYNYGKGLIEKIANVTNGTFTNASNTNDLVTSVKNAVISSINDVTTSSAPGVSVSTDGVTLGSDLFLPLFYVPPREHWWGTIAKVSIDGENGYFASTDYDNDGVGDTLTKDDNGQYIMNTQVKEKFASLSAGSDKYYNEAAINAVGKPATSPAGFSIGNEVPVRKDIYDSTGGYRVGKVFYVEEDTTADTLRSMTISDDKGVGTFIRGCEVGQVCSQAQIRPNPLGDFWHSSPQILRYPLGVTGTNYMLAGSNAGFLHVFNSTTGREISLIVPSASLYAKHLDLGYYKNYGKSDLYGVDLKVGRIYYPNNLYGFTEDWVSIGFRRGGNGYTFIKSDDLFNSTIAGKSVVRWKGSSGFYQSWATPSLMIHTASSAIDEKFVIAPSGYHEFFDTDIDNTADFTAATTTNHFFYGSIWDNSTATGVRVVKSDSKAYPVVGKIYPFYYGALTAGDADVTTVASPEYGVFYYTDIVGNVFTKFHGDNPEKIVDFPELSNQILSVTPNRLTLKVFGSAKPVKVARYGAAESTSTTASDREIWVFYGTGDITRVVN